MEIGYSDGANLHCIAASFPKSICVGIAPSGDKVTAGEQLGKAADLQNAFLGELDFRELPKEPDQTYDYIIAMRFIHGATPTLRHR